MPGCGTAAVRADAGVRAVGCPRAPLRVAAGRGPELVDVVAEGEGRPPAQLVGDLRERGAGAGMDGGARAAHGRRLSGGDGAGGVGTWLGGGLGEAGAPRRGRHRAWLCVQEKPFRKGG